jgi:hypothetical protein
MAIPSDQLLIAEAGLAAFSGRVPEHVRDKVQIRSRREGQSFILYEWRRGLMDPDVWHEEPVAKFTYVQKSNRWKLLCMGRSLKWRRYDELPESDDIADLLNEVDQDPCCWFWG